MPRAGLNAEVVVTRAADLADELGHDAVTLAAVAGSFGVAVPSLYKHVGGLEDLRRRVAAASVRELGEVLAAATAGRGRSEAFAALAHAYRDHARRHPGRYAASVRAPDAEDADHVDASDAVLTTVLDVLASYGLEGDAAIDAARGVRAALHGFLALEAAGGFGLPRDVDRSFDRLVGALERALPGW